MRLALCLGRDKEKGHFKFFRVIQAFCLGFFWKTYLEGLLVRAHPKCDCNDQNKGTYH